MSATSGTTPISSSNFPPAEAGMRYRDVSAVATLMGRGSGASGPLGDLLSGPETSEGYLKFSLASW